MKSSVTIAAAMQPKNPGNKMVEWSLNVDENIATINDKGQMKVGKLSEIGRITASFFNVTLSLQNRV